MNKLYEWFLSWVKPDRLLIQKTMLAQALVKSLGSKLAAAQYVRAYPHNLNKTESNDELVYRLLLIDTQERIALFIQGPYVKG